LNFITLFSCQRTKAMKA